MKEDYHIDLSNRFYSKKTTGIAFVGAKTKRNKGCALSDKFKKDLKKHLFKLNFLKEYAKLYAICIYYLIGRNLQDINQLIICNDEIFSYVKRFLLELFRFEKKDIRFPIISIREYRRALGRKVSSLADNYARVYARRGLKPTRWNCGKKINVVKITSDMIKEKWKLLKKVSERQPSQPITRRSAGQFT